MKKCYFSNRIYKNTIGNAAKKCEEDIMLFNKMKRRAYALTVLEKDKKIKHKKSIHLTIKDEFGVNDYFANSAVQEAKAKYKNVQENHKLHIESIESKVSRIEKKIKETEKTLKNKEVVLNSIISIHKVLKYNKTAKKAKKLPKFKTYKGACEYLKDETTLTFSVRKKKKEDVDYNIYEFEVCYLKPLIKKLKNKLKMLNHRLDKTKVKLDNLKKSKPTACFGSRSLFGKQHTSYKLNKKLWKEKMVAVKNRNMIISGRKDAKGGNFVYKYDTKTKFLSFKSMDGTEIVLENVFFKYGQDNVNFAVNAEGENRKAVAWSFEDFGEYFIIKCLVDIPKNKDSNYSRADGIVAFDTNVDHLAWSDIDACGNLLDYGIIPFDLTNKTTNQSANIIEKIAIEMVSIAKLKKKPLGREDLDLKKNSKELLYNNKKLNSKLSSFAYEKITSAIDCRADKERVGVFVRNPAFTSQIGKVKYMRKLGVSIHTAASYVIARRCMNFKEKVPKDMKKYIPEAKLHNHHWSHWRQLSTKLKSIEPKYFYKKIDLNNIDTVKDYAVILVK